MNDEPGDKIAAASGSRVAVTYWAFCAGL